MAITIASFRDSWLFTTKRSEILLKVLHFYTHSGLSSSNTLGVSSSNAKRASRHEERVRSSTSVVP